MARRTAIADTGRSAVPAPAALATVALLGVAAVLVLPEIAPSLLAAVIPSPMPPSSP